MLSFEQTGTGEAEDAWRLMAQPARWHEWAPHVRGAWGLGTPEVAAGRAGFARLFGAVPVPARIVAKEAGRSWTWQVGPVRMVHRVAPAAGGCTVAIDLSAPGPLEPVVAATYGPVIDWALGRLARLA
jgi:hypothetical protein